MGENPQERGGEREGSRSVLSALQETFSKLLLLLLFPFCHTPRRREGGGGGGTISSTLLMKGRSGERGERVRGWEEETQWRIVQQ